MSQKLLKQCGAELIGTFALCFVGMLSVHHNPDLLSVALAQGLTIAVMVSAFGAISGGHFNPAITLGVFVAGKLEALRAGAYVLAQLAGALIAGVLLANMFSDTGKSLVAAGTPSVGASATALQAIAVEMVLTFFLVVVYFGTMVDARAPKIGGLAIGLTLTLDILAGGPISGGAMNPARAFGPALASGQWNKQFVYWIGPLLGGAVAGLIYGRWLIKESK